MPMNRPWPRTSPIAGQLARPLGERRLEVGADGRHLRRQPVALDDVEDGMPTAACKGLEAKVLK